MSEVLRVAVIGDVGGHHDALNTALVDLGMERGSGLLPAGLTVVQVGDLVHRGPASDSVVDLVDGILTRQPDQWVQLIGNHEQYYVAEPVFQWPERLSERAQAVLCRWWDAGVMRAAAAVEADDGQEWLITHAGLTQGFWRRLGSPGTARDAAQAINHLDRGSRSPLWRAGTMLGEPASLNAGQLWASARDELLPGWTAPGAPRLPFHQVHGHSSVTDWSSGAVRGLPHVRGATEVDLAGRHTRTTVGSHQIIGVDPGHSRQPAETWQPLVIPYSLVVRAAVSAGGRP